MSRLAALCVYNYFSVYKGWKDNKNVDALSGYPMDSKSDDTMLLIKIQMV